MSAKVVPDGAGGGAQARGGSMRLSKVRRKVKKTEAMAMKNRAFSERAALTSAIVIAHPSCTLFNNFTSNQSFS